MFCPNPGKQDEKYSVDGDALNGTALHEEQQAMMALKMHGASIVSPLEIRFCFSAVSSDRFKICLIVKEFP